MPALVFGNAATVLQLNQAFLGSTPSNLIYNNQLAAVASQGASAFAIAFGTQFVPAAADELSSYIPLANSILTNLNLTAPTIAADKAAELADALPQLLFANRDAIGQVVLNLTNILRNLETDVNWGAAAIAYNQQQANSLAYSSNAANTVSSPTNALTLVGQTYTLTAGFDALVGTAGNDTINAPTNLALGALDTVDGGAGRDILNIFGVDSNGAAQAITVNKSTNVKNVEVVNFAAGAAVTADTTDWAGVESLNVSQAAGAVTLTAAATTAVAVAQAAAGVTVTGGSTQGVTVGAQGGAINLSKAAGAVTVAVTNQGANTITVNDATNVTVTTGAAFTAATTQGAITIGGTKAATGAVSVTNAVSNAAGADSTGAAITVTGGTSVTVNQTATQAVATTAGANNTLTQGAVKVVGTAATTEVTVSQSNAASAANTVLPVTGVVEVNTVTFSALTAGQTAVLGGLTITAPAGGMTAAQVAAAFANLDNGARQGFSAVGTYDGAFIGGWTSGAASGATVVFTRTATGATTDLVAGGTGTNPTVVETVAGVTAVSAAGRGGIVGGKVEIEGEAGANAKAITSVSLTGWGATSTVKADGLTSLSLANSNQSLTVTNATAGTLALSLSGVGTVTNAPAGPSAVSLAGYKTINVTTANANSSVNLTAAALETLTVAGTNALNLTGSTVGALKAVTVTGAAGVTLAAPATLETFNASGTTGNNTLTAVDATKVTYTGGAGTDTVTLTSTTVTKALALGAGNDRVNLADGTTAITAAVTGGDGTDTVSVLLANAVTFAGGTQFAGNVTGFEVLGLRDAAGGQTLDISKLGSFNSVNVLTNSAAGTTTLEGFKTGGTLTISANQGNASTVAVKGADFKDGTADSFNVVLTNDNGINGRTVEVAEVETLALTVTDSNTTAGGGGIETHALTLTAADATNLTITGNAGLNLTLTGSTKLGVIDASAMTAALNVTSTSTVSVTITGGAGADTLTAATGTVAHTLIGGAGADTLVANAGLSVLTGGAGFDTFVIQTASTNVNSYSTITDATKGDYIRFVDTAGAETFSQSKITLAGTAVFQDFANAAIATNTVQGGISWFQFGGDTFIVQEIGLNTANTFTNGTDIIVRLTGLVDLSLASFDTGAIEIRIG